MVKTKYIKPEIISHSPIRFETAASGGTTDTSSFPGLGKGVNGTPAKERGDFPGGKGTFFHE